MPEPLNDLEQENKLLRRLLWNNHGHRGLYGDDGEMQCSECGIDFKRMKAVSIADLWFRRNLNWLEENGHIVRALLHMEEQDV